MLKGDRILIHFPFEIKPKQSVRKGRSITENEVFYQPKDIKKFERDCVFIAKTQLRNVKKLEGAIFYRATYVFKYPKSFSKKLIEKIESGQKVYKITKPDLTDNINKGFIDAISPLIMENDSRIAKVDIEKIYGTSSKIICEFIKID